ncbi:MAG TPA: cysteine peptidase family C39 domain-containing protein, partial [Candidatus Kapabacteria bacterium]|nr:cysteine peptidase family C39 domain-containing protein [Candidatus Kapabacteria bacterium]
MGFYPQNNRWQCGPFALKHALAIVGHFVDEDSITRAARTTKEGTDEKMLRRAAERFDCRLIEVRRFTEVSAFKALKAALVAGKPCMICINQWGHWVTIVGFDAKSERFVVIDSEKDPVVRIPAWSELKRRWVFNEYDREGKLKQFYDLYVLRPRFRVHSKANFSIKRAQFLRRAGNATFVKHFDEYVSDLLNIAKPTPSRDGSAAVISMAEFLRRHRKMLLDTVRYWHGQTTDAKLRRVLDNMRFV